MSSAAQMMAVGMPAEMAKAVGGGVASALTATGSTQATAFALGAPISAFSTAAASTGAVLPAVAAPGDQYTVYNGGANSMTIYPPLGGTINNLSANTGLALATLKSGTYLNIGGLAWASLLSA